MCVCNRVYYVGVCVMHASVRVCVCMCGCMYVLSPVLLAHTPVCMDGVCMCVRVSLCVDVCDGGHVCVCVCTAACAPLCLPGCMHACMYARLGVCVRLYACMYVYMCTHFIVGMGATVGPISSMTVVIYV